MDELIQRRATVRRKDTEDVIKEPLEESVLEDIKVRTCFVAPFDRSIKLWRQRFESEEEAKEEPEEVLSNFPNDVKYPLDGDKVLVIPGALRESVCEVLFEMYGDEHTIPTLIIDAILQCSVDSRRQLASNIVIIGGTAMLAGFNHRLILELKALVNSNRYENKLHLSNFKLHTNPCPSNYTSWLGAAIFASTDVLTTRSITLEQYLRNNQTISDWSDWLPKRG